MALPLQVNSVEIARSQAAIRRIDLLINEAQKKILENEEKIKTIEKIESTYRFGPVSDETLTERETRKTERETCKEQNEKLRPSVKKAAAYRKFHESLQKIIAYMDVRVGEKSKSTTDFLDRRDHFSQVLTMIENGNKDLLGYIEEGIKKFTKFGHTHRYADCLAELKECINDSMLEEKFGLAKPLTGEIHISDISNMYSVSGRSLKDILEQEKIKQQIVGRFDNEEQLLILRKESHDNKTSLEQTLGNEYGTSFLSWIKKCIAYLFNNAPNKNRFFKPEQSVTAHQKTLDNSDSKKLQ